MYDISCDFGLLGLGLLGCACIIVCEFMCVCVCVCVCAFVCVCPSRVFSLYVSLSVCLCDWKGASQRGPPSCRYTIQPEVTGNAWDGAADRALVAAVAAQAPESHDDVDWRAVNVPQAAQAARARLRALCKRIRDADFKPLCEVLDLVAADLDSGGGGGGGAAD